MEPKFKPGDKVKFRSQPQETYEVIESIVAPSGVLHYVLLGFYPGYLEDIQFIVPFYDVLALDEPTEMTPQEKAFYNYNYNYYSH